MRRLAGGLGEGKQRTWAPALRLTEKMRLFVRWNECGTRDFVGD